MSTLSHRPTNASLDGSKQTQGDPSHPNTLFPGGSSVHPLHLELKLWSDMEIKFREGRNVYKSRVIGAQTQAWGICT